MKKGFTLIELLAVIVILAIIALIATPIILGIINDAKEDSEKRSVENYAHAVELAVARYAASHDGVIPSGNFTIKDEGKSIEQDSIKIPVDYKGEKVEGKVNVLSEEGKEGRIELNEISFNGGKTKYNYSEIEGVTKVETSESSEINMIAFYDEYSYDDEFSSTLFYYKGSGDVVIDDENIVKINERAFAKNNVFIVEYEVSDGNCSSGHCKQYATIFILDPSIEKDLRNYYANNSLEYEVEVIVPKTSEEIEEKFFEIVNGENNNVFKPYADYYQFENGQLNEEAIGYETNITSIDLSKLVNGLDIDKQAFAYMTSLKTIKLPIKFEDLYEKCFNGNTALEKIIIPYKEGEFEKTPWWNYDEALDKHHTIEYGTLINEDKYASF